MPSRKTNEEYIKQLRQLYGDEYSLGNTKYSNNYTKVSVECNIHGTFYRNPLMLLNGYGCPYCSDKKHFYSFEEYIKILKSKYGELYSVTEEDFCNRDKKLCVKFKCDRHGYFSARPSSLLKETYCKGCKEDKKLAELSNKVKEYYGNNYDVLSQAEVNIKQIKIRCNRHNIVNSFWKTHLFKNKFICNECLKEKQLKENKEKFFEKANDIYDSFYNYIDDYINSQTPITAICPIHGEFKVTPNDHIEKHSGCPKCGNKRSDGEEEIYNFCKTICDETIRRDKEIISPYELDIVLPNKNIAIEYDGILWHSEKYKDNAKYYHLDKTKRCDNNAFKLIHIFEDEWLEKSAIVKSMLRNIIAPNFNAIAIVHKIKQVPTSDAIKFLEENYINGKHYSTYRFGLYNNNELVSLATFKKSGKNDTYHLQCFCNKLGVNVQNGNKVLLEAFINEVNPSKIIAKADRRFSYGNEFEGLGFQRIGETAPNYYYCKRQHRYNKSNFTKERLIKQGYDKGKTVHQIMNERGFYRIYDCGYILFEMNLIT